MTKVEHKARITQAASDLRLISGGTIERCRFEVLAAEIAAIREILDAALGDEAAATPDATAPKGRKRA